MNRMRITIVVRMGVYHSALHHAIPLHSRRSSRLAQWTNMGTLHLIAIILHYRLNLMVLQPMAVIYPNLSRLPRVQNPFLPARKKGLFVIDPFWASFVFSLS